MADGGVASETIEIITPRRTGLVLELQDESGVRRVPITSAPLVVGSSREADLVLRDRAVSARHCALTAEEAGVHVRDLGSRNGTYIGGARVSEGWVVEESTIVVGNTVLACRGSRMDPKDDGSPPLPGIAGSSLAMSRVASQVRRLANLAAPVLIAGESGSGKELIARALHSLGQRAAGPFVALNASALPRELVESELFGHERGAFTGAVNRRLGAFVEAEGGTLFLDEIGDLALEAQPKLLRALDGYEVRAVGGAGSGRRADVRVVVATHVPLLAQVQAGRFRRDLYHRLEVFVIDLPPLRERPEDILPIARTFLEQMTRDFGPCVLSNGAVGRLAAHSWPGNVRELKGVLMRAADVAAARGSSVIDVGAISDALRPTAIATVSMSPARAQQLLALHGGNVSAAARAATLPRTTFRKLLAERPDVSARSAR